MNRAEMYRTILDTLSDFSFPDENLIVDTEGSYTSLALNLSRILTDALEEEF
jgi:hypothetical protein